MAVYRDIEHYYKDVLKFLRNRVKGKKVNIHIQHIDRLMGDCLEISFGNEQVFYVTHERPAIKRDKNHYLFSIDGKKADHKLTTKWGERGFIVGIPDTAGLINDIVREIDKRFGINCDKPDVDDGEKPHHPYHRF